MAKLRFIAISGTTDVTENLYVYEYVPDSGQTELIVVDCGVGFPEEAAFGVDLSIPDFSYLVKNQQKIKGVFISHAHEDHFGALPFLLQEIKNLPIYTSKLVAGFVNDKLAEYGIRNVKMNIIDPEGSPVAVGSFIVDAFRVTHSVPDSLGFCISTPVGKFFHVPDYKFDWTPVDQKPFDIAKAARLAQSGVLALAADCLGATSDGYTKSELELEENIELIMEGAKRAVYFTTISSNISRMQQAINASKTVGRKVVLVGRSIESKVEIAKRLGYIYWGDGQVIPAKEARGLPPSKLTYIISGCYGQVGSALYRVSLNEHEFLKINQGDVVVFSADPAPPGTGQTTNFVVDNLIELGAEVHYYDTQEDLHVSGHGSQKEIEMLLALVEPRYLLPIGGTIRHMRAYSVLAQRMGWNASEVFELRQGDVVEFTRETAKKTETIPVKSILVDGLGIGDVGEVVLRDRKTLAREGIVIVVAQVNRGTSQLLEKPEIISRGFVFEKNQQEFLERASREVAGEIRRRTKRGDGRLVKDTIRGFLENFFFTETGRRPMILPVVVEV